MDGGEPGEVRRCQLEALLRLHQQRPVYEARQIQKTQHTPAVPLEPCKTYRWSVRPAFSKDGEAKNGTWMRRVVSNMDGNGNSGRAISEAHAYVQDFPVLQVDRKARRTHSRYRTRMRRIT